jgi:thymidine kinase
MFAGKASKLLETLKETTHRERHTSIFWRREKVLVFAPLLVLSTQI